ncbi:hypothetical protein ACNO8S_12740 [Haloarcula sp. KBTZ06]|uniref:Uncharacterized protein n=1 Tax=Haloarcula hispanica TaxID=51589 RepID=A0A482T3Q4_HALHI|nr:MULTISPECIES: hypothetical protein [Haloarcula]KZX47281.1 hypothetical protein AV929_02830 [Haloarcula sp. K1]MCJ0619909.1 hypothetical protein [Haloarcula hispanica]MUV48847.1 hypothetical protein [Haloarcula sp. CBA1122]RYJ10351.1 hypothetical protein ELS20_10350 [Haloarcula hispanica]
MAEYQPGVCNIGANQRRARRLSAIASFAVAIGIALAATLGAIPDLSLWATVPFVFGGYVGALQDYFRFCVAFGALARYDLSGSGGESGRVDASEAVRADRRKAAKILLLATVATAVTSGFGAVLLRLA